MSMERFGGILCTVTLLCNGISNLLDITLCFFRQALLDALGKLVDCKVFVTNALESASPSFR